MLLTAMVLCVSTWAYAQQEQTMRMYVGTYTGPASEGIYFVDLNVSTGALSEPVLAAKTKNPAFLATHPNGRWIYAALEVGDFNGRPTGGVGAFAIDEKNNNKTGTLTPINAESSEGNGACFVSVTHDGKAVLVANYGGGNVALLPIDPNTGAVRKATSVDQHHGSSANAARQQRAFAHSIYPTPDGRFALSANLGTDEVIVYRLDTTAGTLTRIGEAKLPPGTGPRHLAFHPSGKFVFAIGELTNRVHVLTWNGDTGALTPADSAPTLPEDFKLPNTTAEVTVSADGRFVYGSNRGHDSIAVLSFDVANGALVPVAHTSTGGVGPRHFALSADGKFLVAANQTTSTLVCFAIDPKTGTLSPTGSQVKVGNACCVRFVGSLARE